MTRRSNTLAASISLVALITKNDTVYSCGPVITKVIKTSMERLSMNDLIGRTSLPKKFVSKWREILKWNLKWIYKNLQDRKRFETKDEEPLAAELHQSNAIVFYSTPALASHYISHLACFSCLVRELPEHPLPCGRILCTRRVNSYGIKNASGQVTLKEYPLHPIKMRWIEPWQIRIKPLLAVVRIPTLDG